LDGRTGFSGPQQEDATVKQTLKIILASFLVTAAAIKAAPALAEDVQPHSYTVRTADLDLGSAAGQRTLDHRLAIAVVEVCGTPSDVDLAGKNHARECRAGTSARLDAERDRRIAGVVDAASPIRIASR
jgi:UrcA family protein